MVRNERGWVVRHLDRVAFASSVAGVFCFTLVAVGIVFLLPLSSANRDVAVGNAIALGVFLLAFIAAVTAVVAYVQASRRPALHAEWQFFALRDWREIKNEFLRDRRAREPFSGDLPNSVRPEDLIPLEPVRLKVRIVNDGEVAASHAAVVFFLEGIYFSPPPTVDPGELWRFIPDEKGWKIQWEGGMSALIYKEIARAPTADLTGMWALPHIEHTDWGGVIAVADGVKEPEIQELKMNAPSSPASAAPVEETPVRQAS